MKRRDFLKTGSVAALGTLFSSTLRGNQIKEKFQGRKAKNIIFMVSDGMSSGTLAMADLYSRRKLGRTSAWVSMYENGLVQRALMDMASANSIVTDSAAASSSWGGGVRVNNGSLNVSPNGKENLPILQKFKKSGKKVGCVTTVPITHATPAGFSISTKSRNDMEDIAELYADINFDVMMGGGNKYFDPAQRKNKKDMFSAFRAKGYSVVKNKAEMMAAPAGKPVLGTFDEDGLPYSIDQKNIPFQEKNVPTLAEMTTKAINLMKDHEKGFAMQVEGGKVDWAAHGNDIAALLYDQLAFDDAVKVALDFAKTDGNTLVVVTSDHGNANPGLIYGKNVNDNFDRMHHFKHSNEWILQGISPDFTTAKIVERVAEATGGMKLSDTQAAELLSFYTKAKREDGVYNPRHLPFKLLAELQKDYISVGWISMDHSSDYTELAMYGPGSEMLKPFMRNVEIHNFLLNAAQVVQI